MNYIDAYGQEQTANATALTSSNVNSLAASGAGNWYYLGSDIDINTGTINLTGSGAVHLILTDGKQLKACKVKGSTSISLFIYGQKSGTGKLILSNTTGGGSSSGTSNIHAYISSNKVTINGGSISLSTSGGSTKNYAYINGEGGTNNPGAVNINGGNITFSNMSGNNYKAFITCNYTDNSTPYNYNGAVNIKGGTIKLLTQSNEAFISGIYRGNNQAKGTVTIDGGNIELSSTNNTVNITGSKVNKNVNGILTINGGNITLSGNQAFIAGNEVQPNQTGSNGTVIINGGQITVNGSGIKGDSITLGYTNYDDFIKVSDYLKSTPKIADGKIFVNAADTSQTFSGNSITASDIKDKKLIPLRCLVKFNANNGRGTMESQKFVYGTAQALTANAFTHDGIFKGWNTKADGSGTSYIDGQDISSLIENYGELTLYAQWDLTRYKINYELNEGTNDSANPASYTVEDAITLKAPTREGYEFAGWTLNGQTVTEIAKGSTGDKTLTATWTPITYKITYDLDGGSATNPTTYTIETESFTLNNPTKDGYTFTGWTGTDLTAETKNVTIKKGSRGNRKYTANYTQNQHEQEPEQITLESLNVSISGSESPYTTERKALKLTYTANVNASYSDGSSKTLEAKDYSLTWTLDKNISGIAINNGTLSVSDSTENGKYSLTITAEASQGGIKGSGVKNITLHVYKREVTTDVSNLDNMTTHEKNAIEYLALNDTSDKNSDNKITDLSQIDFTDFTNLNTLNLSGLKNLEQADLSQLPDNVKEVSLQESNITLLNLNNSKVEYVNAKGCKNLEKIDAEYNESLIELDVSESNISVINVKDCTNLQVLNCSSCDLEAGYLNLEGCSSLTSLDISKNHFGWFDYNESNNMLNNFDCYSQDITGWESKTTFNFTKFFNSGDVTAAGVEIMASAYVNNVYDITGYNESGDKIPSEYDSETGVAAFESAPAVIKYFYNTAFKNSSMDVTIRASSYTDEEANYHLGDSGGCSVRLSFSSLIFAVFVFIFTRKR